jgi:hypothetical protein
MKIPAKKPGFTLKSHLKSQNQKNNRPKFNKMLTFAGEKKDKLTKTLLKKEIRNALFNN